jgi:hypothetical protein
MKEIINELPICFQEGVWDGSDCEVEYVVAWMELPKLIGE